MSWFATHIPDSPSFQRTPSTRLDCTCFLLALTPSGPCKPSRGNPQAQSARWALRSIGQVDARIRVRSADWSRWWRRRDSNPRPPGCKPGALPTELRPRAELVGTHPGWPCAAGSRLRQAPPGVVGLTGLEPETSRLSGGRSNQLSYRPVAPQDPYAARRAAGHPKISCDSRHRPSKTENLNRMGEV